MDIQVKFVIDVSDKLSELVRSIVNTVDDALNRPNAEVLSLPLSHEQVAKETSKPVQTTQEPAVNKVSEPEATPAPVEQEATFDSIFGADEPDDPASTQVDLNTVQSKVAELIRQGKKPQVADALKKMGVTGYSQLRGQDLTDFYNTIQKL